MGCKDQMSNIAFVLIVVLVFFLLLGSGDDDDHGRPHTGALGDVW